MNLDSRESLLRDGPFEGPRRDSFIRDEFAGSPHPTPEANEGRDQGLSEFYSESEWEGPRGRGFRPQRAEIILGVAVVALIVGAVSIWTLVGGRGAAAAQPAAVAAVTPLQSAPAAAAGATAPETTPAPARPGGGPQPAARQSSAAPPIPVTSVRQTPRPVTPRDASSRPAATAQSQTNLLMPTLLADTPLETSSSAGVRAEAARSMDPYGVNRVYSSADDDVIPPKMIVEDVPAALIVGMRTRTQAVELMVTEEGDVSRVRLVTEQRRILDTMLLSRAKMWRFTPALRQGRPVPYRLVVLWETND